MNESKIKSAPAFELKTTVYCVPNGENYPDRLLQRISYEKDGEPVDIMETWWSQKYLQFFIKIVNTSREFVMSYNGSQYNLFDNIPSTRTMNVPLAGNPNIFLGANKSYYFYPSGPTVIGDYNYSKVQANSYLQLDDCSIFNSNGANDVPPIAFDLHVKKLQDTQATMGYVAILYSLDFLGLT